MRFVEKALTKPSRCAVLPFVGANDEDGYIDTGSELPGKGDAFDCHVYVSVKAVREMARLIGWHSPEAMDEITDRVAQLEEELELVRDDLDKAETVLGAIDALESKDFRARKKPGRRPVRKQEEVTA